VQDGLLTAMANLYPRGIGAWRLYARAGWRKLRGGVHGRLADLQENVENVRRRRPMRAGDASFRS
jgi:hypothetical protein